MTSKPPQKIIGRHPTIEEVNSAKEWGYVYKERSGGGSQPTLIFELKLNCNCKGR